MVLIPLLILLCFVLFSQRGRVLHFERPVSELLRDIAEARRQYWQDADAVERERTVRQQCGWRVIGRIAGASALVTGALLTASPALGVMWALAAWRVVKPIKQELRDACSYRSTGRSDERPHSS